MGGVIFTDDKNGSQFAGSSSGSGSPTDRADRRLTEPTEAEPRPPPTAAVHPTPPLYIRVALGFVEDQVSSQIPNVQPKSLMYRGNPVPYTFSYLTYVEGRLSKRPQIESQ